MEPTFIATPYAQARSPLSGQIRAWLDQQEAGYTQWRASRRPVTHSFASAKLNSPLRAAPRAAKSASSTPVWMTLGNQASEAVTTKTSSATSDSRVVTLATAASRRSSLSTPTLPALSKREAARQSVARKSVRLADLPPAAKPAPRVRTSALAKQRLQEHLYAFHSCHVFSYAKRPDKENQDEQAEHETWPSATSESLSESSSSDTRVDDTLLQSSDPDSPTPAPATTVVRNLRCRDDCVLEGLALMTSEDYDRIFDHDWRLSDVERVVHDAVERTRIRQILRLSYRTLLWFFRFYTGKTGLASGGGGGASNAQALFQVADKLKLLEDLNVACVEPAKFGVTDAPLTRDGIVAFVLSVARMMSAHTQSSARHRALAAEGIEVSDATKALVRDYFGSYAQLQDADHFRNIFLRSERASTRPRRLQEVLSQHTEDLRNFFSETARATGSGHRETTTPAAGPVPQDATRLSVSLPQFLSALRALGAIATPKAASSTAPTASQPPTASAPAAVDEGRVLRAFLSCLPMAESEGSNPRSAGVSTHNATFEQFVEALLRVALLRRELGICRGGYDVCPGQLASEVCSCDPERASYDFAAFDAAAEELVLEILALRRGRARTRASLKMQTHHDYSNNSNNSSVPTSKLSIVQKTGARLALPPIGSDDRESFKRF